LPERNRIAPTAGPAPYSALPEPMLAKSGKLPTRGRWSYEVKWDGFRAIVSTEGRCGFAASVRQAKSRIG